MRSSYSKIIIAAVVLGLIALAAYQQLSVSTPQEAGLKFLKTVDTKEMADYLTEEDEQTYKEHSAEFGLYSGLDLVKSPAQNVVFKEIVDVSENQKQVYYEADGRKVGLNLVKQGSWKVQLGLTKKQQIYEAQINLKEASLKGDEQEMLEAYNLINQLDPQEIYQQEISKLAAKIDRQQQLLQYVDKVQVSKISLSKGMVSAFIQNLGNKNLTKLVGKVVVTHKGKILVDETRVLFERIPDNRLYNKAIPGGYERKIGFDLSSLGIPAKDLELKITPVEVDYE